MLNNSVHFHLTTSLPHHQAFQRQAFGLQTQAFSGGYGFSKKNVLKGTRWLLLRARRTWTMNKDEKGVPKKLQAALKLNEPLAVLLHEGGPAEAVDWTDKKAAEWHLKSWIAMAQSLENPHAWYKFANTLSAHRTVILAYFDHKISTGPHEGTNNKIKTMK